MPARQLVFEGPDPEQLLIEAWSQHGTSVRISEPACVRKGGVLGFFAKLHYRIEVEPAASDHAAQAETGAGDRAVTPASATAATTPASALDLLVESTEDVLELHGGARRSFDQVLHGVASSLGDEPSMFDAPRLDVPGDTSVQVAEASWTDDSTDPAGGTPGRPEEAAAQGTHGPAPVGRRPRTSRPDLEHPLELVQQWAARREATGVSDLPAASGVPARPSPGEEAEREVGALAAIGFPPGLLARLGVPEDGLSYAEAAFGLAPAARPLPRVPGALVAVLGELGRALEVAGGILDELQLPDAEIAVATPVPPGFAMARHLLVGDARTGAELAPGWRRDAVGLVVVDSASPGATTTWIRKMLHGVRPTATWAIASATAKHEDVRHFADAVGGIDALVLDQLDATVTPAAILQAAIPVAKLEGAPATPSAWVEAVAPLLAAATSRSVR